MNKWLIAAFILTLGVVGFAQTDVVKPVSDVGKIMPTILDTLDDSTVVVISPEGDTITKPMPKPVEIDSSKNANVLKKVVGVPAEHSYRRISSHHRGVRAVRRKEVEQPKSDENRKKRNE